MIKLKLKRLKRQKVKLKRSVLHFNLKRIRNGEENTVFCLNFEKIRDKKIVNCDNVNLVDIFQDLEKY